MTRREEESSSQESGASSEEFPVSVSVSLPVPVPNFDNAGFWEACRRHELRVQRCHGCGALRHPPRPMCPHCNSVAHEWARLSGQGKVHTFTIVHGPTLPVFQARAPYNVAVIELAEGPFMVSNVVACGLDQICIGMAVEIVFEDASDEIRLPKFRPA